MKPFPFVNEIGPSLTLQKTIYSVVVDRLEQRTVGKRDATRNGTDTGGDIDGGKRADGEFDAGLIQSLEAAAVFDQPRGHRPAGTGRMPLANSNLFAVRSQSRSLRNP
ncbi:hypothetical protein D3C80_1782810 [compost metagenome]